MADKDSVSDWDTVPDNNDNIAGIPLAENQMRVRDVNNAFRNMMAQIKTAIGSVAVDLGATIHALTAKATPVDADEFGLSDSAASNAGKKSTLAQLKAVIFAGWGALIAAGINKATPVDGDMVNLADSAASNATKYVTFTQMWTAYFKGKADALYQPLKTILTTLGALANASGVLTNNGSGSLSWAAAPSAGEPITTSTTLAVNSRAVVYSAALANAGSSVAGSGLHLGLTSAGQAQTGTWLMLDTISATAGYAVRTS